MLVQFLFERRHNLVYALLVLVAVSLLMATGGPAGKWLTTAGLMLDITGLVQLEISVFYKMNLEHFSDEKKFPYGPPSVIMREIMEEDHRWEWVASMKRGLFMEPATGFGIIIVGCLVQLVGAWL